MKRLPLVLAGFLFIAVNAVAGTQVMHLTLGKQQVTNLKKCASGSCIGVIVEVPKGNHVTKITKSGSDFVHPCDQTYNCGHNDVFIKVPGFPNQAQWLGWTDSGDPGQAFDLTITYEKDTEP
jgi:hypothetical protein